LAILSFLEGWILHLGGADPLVRAGRPRPDLSSKAHVLTNGESARGRRAQKVLPGCPPHQ
jgi:hypothetical protein